MNWRDLIVTTRPTVPLPKLKGSERRTTEETPAPALQQAAQEVKEVEVVAPGDQTAPEPPLRPGWLVVYRGADGRLAGGCDDRAHGTVQSCPWNGRAFMVFLTDGQHVSLQEIRSVRNGEIAWTVREHGYDGEGIKGIR